MELLPMKSSALVVWSLFCAGCGSSGGGQRMEPATKLSVEATAPKDGADDVLRDGRIWVRFSEPVEESSVKLSFEPKAEVTFRYSEASGRELTYELVEPLARTT